MRMKKRTRMTFSRGAEWQMAVALSLTLDQQLAPEILQLEMTSAAMGFSTSETVSQSQVSNTFNPLVSSK
jgi:hypothetical protein